LIAKLRAVALRPGWSYALLCLPPLFWAGNMVVGRAMRNDIPPVAMTFWRWSIAGLLLIPFVMHELRDHGIRTVGPDPRTAGRFLTANFRHIPVRS
jgi:drug/metabolite transporter (DMT)-like permease